MQETKTYKKLRSINGTNKPEYIIVHHTGGTDKYPLADTAHHTAEIIEGWHLSKGWDGIGYHYVIHKDGQVWKGRPESYHGAHARGYNQKSIGIVLSGNFDATLPTDAQTKSLRKLLIDVSEQYGIPSDKVIPHRHVANKTCYGKNLSDEWARDLVTNVEPVINESNGDIEKRIKRLEENQKFLIELIIQLLNK